MDVLMLALVFSLFTLAIGYAQNGAEENGR
jgi:hypothetical protein